MSLPAWLQRALGDTYRSVRLRVCTRCNAPVLAGLDADVAAFSVRAELTPLTALGEAMALLAGRRTFDLVGGGGDKQLHIREEHNIRAGTRRYPVFAEHRCGQALTAYAEEVATTASPKKLPSTPPY